jgi:aminomethyltransferase
MGQTPHDQTSTATPIKTALADFHERHGGKMVDFAGYWLPVQYAEGVMGEHLHCRAKAGLFDVSHMGQARLVPLIDGDLAAVFEELVPGGVTSLADLRIRYTLFTNDSGGIVDDLMVTRWGRDLWLVVNAACKDADFAHIAHALDGRAELIIQDQALLALQGPAAVDVLSTLVPDCAQLPFMAALPAVWQGHDILVSRCGYTGEDGFEISLPNVAAEAFAEALIAHPAVGLCGLGARDSLRLEAGLCLYGHDIDTTTTPNEADLMWTIPRRRRDAADFPGAEVICGLKPARLRVGIKPDGRAPAREGTVICDKQGREIGHITSGGFSPSLSAPIAKGYIASEFSALGTEIDLMIRGKAQPATIVALPFVPHRYVSTK